MTTEGRILGVMAAAAHDITEELTIIFSALEQLEPEDDEAGLELSSARAAAQRLAWKALGMANYAALRLGTPLTCVPMERLILDGEGR